MMLPGAAQHERTAGYASSMASSAAAPKEELLGGELVVKIEDATVGPSALAPGFEQLLHITS